MEAQSWGWDNIQQSLDVGAGRSPDKHHYHLESARSMPGTVLSARTSSYFIVSTPNEVRYNPCFIDVETEFGEVKSLIPARTARKG